MTDPIRVLIADDHPLFRDGLTAMLQADDDTELTGAATDGLQAVELALHSQPDVVVMDLHMPGMDGIEATRRMVAADPEVFVILVSTLAQADLPVDVEAIGARAYLSKETFDAETLRRIWSDGRPEPFRGGPG